MNNETLDAILRVLLGLGMTGFAGYAVYLRIELDDLRKERDCWKESSERRWAAYYREHWDRRRLEDKLRRLKNE